MSGDTETARLREEIALLREEVASLNHRLAEARAAIIGEGVWPARFRLTPAEQRFINCLLRWGSPTWEQISFAYQDGRNGLDFMATRTLHVYATRVRRKLRADIRNDFGRGYTIPEAERERLLALREGRP
jgi:hypothetical protein